jgi:hypothetical protein
MELVRAHVRYAATALYSRRHDTTVPARTEPRDTACGSPPFGSRSLARGVGPGSSRSCCDRRPPPPAPPPLRRGGVTPPTVRRGLSAFAPGAALQSAEADFALCCRDFSRQACRQTACRSSPSFAVARAGTAGVSWIRAPTRREGDPKRKVPRHPRRDNPSAPAYLPANCASPRTRPALLGVGRVEEDRLQLALQRQPLLQRKLTAALAGALDVAHRQARLPRTVNLRAYSITCSRNASRDSASITG